MLKSSHLDEAAVIKSSINFSTVIKSTDITSNSSKEKHMTMTQYRATSNKHEKDKLMSEDTFEKK